MSRNVVDLILRGVATFVPELKPLAPEIEAAVETVQKAEAIAGPYFSGSSPPNFFSIIPLFPALEPMFPDILKAAQTFAKVEKIGEEYAAKLAAAEAAK